MLIQKNSLYKRLNKDLIEKYSRLKFGEAKIIDLFAKKISSLIINHIVRQKKYVIYTTNKFPTRDYYKKNSLLLAEKIADKCNLPLIIGEYQYSYNNKTFCDYQIKRKIHLPKIKKKDKLKYKDYIFIMIDDSIVTGASLNASLKELEGVAKEVLFFSIIDLSKSKYSEGEVNDFQFKKGKLKYLIKVINSKNYILTTQILRTIDKLKKEEIYSLLENMENGKQILPKSFKEYTGRNLLR